MTGENLSESIGLRLSGTRCRICLLSDEEAKKKMVCNICNCKGKFVIISRYVVITPYSHCSLLAGASGNVHIECLEMWITSSNRDHCEVCLEKIYIEKVPKFGVLRSIPIFLYSSRISQLFMIMLLIGIAIYVSSMWYIDRLSFKRDSNFNKIMTFVANLSIFGSVFIISYSPLLCLYVWDLWKEWRKSQYRLRIKPRVHNV